VCTSPNLPGIFFASSSDISQTLPVIIECRRLETPVEGSSEFRGWATFWRLLKLIPQF
jgi:hypothetical protein